MNYYIDFDNTLYNTTILAKDMCHSIALKISESTSKSLDQCDKEVKNKFNRENIYNIYDLCDYFSNKYLLNVKEAKNDIDRIILNSSKNLFNDTVPFLESLKSNGHTINLLTYVTKENLPYQLLKLNGSNIGKYLDDIIVTSTLKFDLDLNYKDGIFIDDNPRDLKGLYSTKPFKLIRIKRPENKYSIKDLDIPIEEYTSLKDIPIVKE